MFQLGVFFEHPLMLSVGHGFRLVARKFLRMLLPIVAHPITQGAFIDPVIHTDLSNRPLRIYDQIHGALFELRSVLFPLCRDE